MSRAITGAPRNQETTATTTQQSAETAKLRSIQSASTPTSSAEHWRIFGAAVWLLSPRCQGVVRSLSAGRRERTT